jgi:hypothetical protein
MLMAVSPAIAAEADKFVEVIQQRAHARNLSLEGTRWHPSHNPDKPNDRIIELTITCNGKPYTFDLHIVDLLLFSQGHHPKGDTREQRAEVILDRIVQNP